MLRDSDRLPTSALQAVRQILDRIEAEALAEDTRAIRARRERTRAISDDDLLSSRHRRDTGTLHDDYRSAMRQHPDRVAEHGEACRLALDIIQSAYDAERKRLEEVRDALRDEQITREHAATTLRRLGSTLSDAARSQEGLAPWDATVLDVLRERRLVPQSDPDLPAMLKGVDAATLVQNALGVSRSGYYDRYRPLLRCHYLMPTEFEKWDGAYYVSRQRSGLRFRRDEVEALVRFVTLGTVESATYSPTGKTDGEDRQAAQQALNAV